MKFRFVPIACCSMAVVCAIQALAVAQDCPLDMKRPACGKVCKLVCETKKLTAIGYGNECKTICLPGPSRQGSKHCAACCGKCKCDPCICCQESAPKCEFCWRDWFACGCAKPRTVKVLTKWQAEKKICWYHWEVVDASSCDGVTKSDASVDAKNGVSTQAPGTNAFFKPAPEGTELGDVLPITDAEWVKLSAAMTPDPNETTPEAVATTEPNSASQSTAPAEEKAGSEKLSLAERVQRLFK